MNTRISILIPVLIGCGLLASAQSGKICYAYPIDHNIIVDGELGDWPDAAIYPIDHSRQSDFNAFFQVSYHPVSNYLYIAMTVEDDDHFEDTGNGRSWDRREDRHILFLDMEHRSDGGSGVLSLFGNQNGKDLSYAHNGWDPFHEFVQREDVVLAIRRHVGKTIYEWRIEAPVSLTPYKTLGIDHYVHDADHGADEIDYYEWGEGGYKDRLPWKLEDLLLLPKDEVLHPVNGTLKWLDQTGSKNLPAIVKIQSLDHRDFWTLAKIDSLGNYSAELPKGRYEVRPFLRTVEIEGQWDIERVDDGASVNFSVPQSCESIPTLAIPTFAKPDYLIPAVGMLNDKGEINPTDLDKIVEAFKDYYQIPGVSLAVVKNGHLALKRHYGVANATTMEPVSDRTRFEIASVSKTLFAFLVHRLTEKGILDMDKPLFDYVPFESIVHDGRHRKLTARLVLSHQTGLPNWLWNRPRDWENQEKGEFIGDPGDGFYYSGEAYEYLMRVVEKVTGSSVQQLMDVEVFGVFGMTQSSYTAKPDFSHEIAVGHYQMLPMYWEVHQEPWVAGSMYSTVEDLSRFAVGLLNQKGLSSEGYKEMWEPQIAIEPWVLNYGGSRQYWSLGFEVEDTPEGRFYHHDGSNGDFESRLCINPEKNYGYILLTNNGHGEYLDRVMQRALFTGRSDMATPQFD